MRLRREATYATCCGWAMARARGGVGSSTRFTKGHGLHVESS
jgi:hypothetical protein